MPWHVAKSSSCPDNRPFAVIKDSDGSTVACHATKESAQKQIAALYASESAEVKPQLIPRGSMTTVELSEQGAILSEGVKKPGRLNVQIITPGWGSSGYYPPETLQQAAEDKVFPAGTHMYLDHPTAFEAEERPNRSIKDLTAVLTEDAKWNGNALVANVRTFGPFASAVAEMVDAIGVSIRADAEVSEGEAEGRRGIVVERLTNARSVDFVTAAGRGGKILQVLESARNNVVEQAITEETPVQPETPEPTAPAPAPTTPEAPPTPVEGDPEPGSPPAAPQDPAANPAEPAARSQADNPPIQEERMPEDSGAAGKVPAATSSRQVLEAQIEEARLENLRLKAREKARGIIAEDLGVAVLTPLVIQRLSEELIESLPLVAGELDAVTLRDRVKDKRERAEHELGEALSLHGGAGQPRGLGSYTVSEGGKAAQFQSVTEQALQGAFGLSKTAAHTAVEGR